jgi:hypothetical protein
LGVSQAVAAPARPTTEVEAAALDVGEQAGWGDPTSPPSHATKTGLQARPAPVPAAKELTCSEQDGGERPYLAEADSFVGRAGREVVVVDVEAGNAPERMDVLDQ